MLKQLINSILLLVLVVLGGCSGGPQFDVNKLTNGSADTGHLTLQGGTIKPSYMEDSFSNLKTPTTVMPSTVSKINDSLAVVKEQKNEADFDKSVTVTAISTTPAASFTDLGTFHFSHKAGKTFPEETKVMMSDQTFRIQRSTITDYTVLTRDKFTDKTKITIRDSKDVIYSVTLFYSNGQVVEIEFPSKALYKSRPTPVTDPSQKKVAVNPQSKKFIVQAPTGKTGWEQPKKIDCGCAQWGPIAWEGLTLYAVSQHYDIPLVTIQNANPKGIRVGEKVCLKKKICSTDRW